MSPPARCEFCSEEVPAGTSKCPFCGEELGRQRRARTGWGTPARPMVVAVFGVLHLSFGVLGLCGLVSSLFMLSQFGGSPMLNQAWGPPGSGLRTFMLVSTGLGAVSNALYLAIGGGLLTMQAWARLLALGTAVYGIVASLVSPAISLPLMMDNMPRAQQTITIASAGLGILVGLAYQALVLFFLTRPHVKAAFERRAGA